ncbi:MAG: metalloprotease TldD [Gammaproteobacteria bacterium]|nr:metalloprotease TldD [Gammaproteobacteria bacterium]
MNVSTNLTLAEKTLLHPAELSHQNIECLLGKLVRRTIHEADFYFQAKQVESWLLEEGIVKEAEYHVDCGVGVRAVSGEKTGFAYSNDIFLPALEQAVCVAGSIAQSGHGKSAVLVETGSIGRSLYPSINPVTSWESLQKAAYLKKLDGLARQTDPRVEQVIVSLAASHEVILIAGRDGVFVADVRPLVRLNVSVIVRDASGRREAGSSGCGARSSYGDLLSEEKGTGCVKEAIRLALTNLEAIPAPAGTFPVVLGPGWPGVLLHEAVGHGLEGDFNRKKSSVFSGRIGEKVASSLCTVVDDGTLPGRRGSLNCDDEGTPTECTVLIEKGVLRGYLQDKQNARLMGMRSTGNGRRESYAYPPLPRMTNTYLLAGADHPDEIIQSVKYGIYAVNFGGGEVDITSGKFVFSANEAYLIEEGKVTAPIKGATLIGNGPEVLKAVSMVGNDLALDPGVGSCGKDGQTVPVGVGQPTVKVDALTVGGTNLR